MPKMEVNIFLPPPPPLEIRLWSRFMFPPKQLHFIVLCAKTLAQHGITTKSNQLLRKLVSLQKNHLGVWKQLRVLPIQLQQQVVVLISNLSSLQIVCHRRGNSFELVGWAPTLIWLL